MVPVERLLKLREVRDIMFSSLLTSQFFLSDEGEDVDMPYALVMTVCYCNRKWTSIVIMTARRGRSRYRMSSRLKTVGLAIIYWTFCVGSVDG